MAFTGNYTCNSFKQQLFEGDFDFSDASWSGAFTARGALIYRVTTGNPAICVLDFGSDKTSTTTFVVEFPPNTSTGALIRLS